MTVKLSLPQRKLLDEAAAAGEKGVFKSTSYGPAGALITLGLARWTHKFSNGATGSLVITEKGKNFRNGIL